MSEKHFSKKIKYLYEKLNLQEKEFTKLFWKGEQDKFSSRHVTVHESWLGEKGIEQVKGFYFDDYGISTRKMNNEMVFTKKLFMYDSFEDFKERVDVYVKYLNEPKILFEYRYIYYYDKRKNTILSSELIVLEKNENEEYKVELFPYNFEEEKEVEIYKGVLRIDNDYYHISVENSFEILTLYFVVGRGYGKKKEVNGIGLGLTYESGLPQATKQLLTKEQLSESEQNDFYITANEMEYIRSDESLSVINVDKKTEYLNHFHKQVGVLATYKEKAKLFLEEPLDNDIYLSIFDETFNRFYEISEKVQKEKEFFVFRRRNAIENFLQNKILFKNNICSIVYPLLENDNALFDKDVDRCREFLELNIQLVKDGLKLNRIFIIDDSFQMTDYFIESIKRLKTAGADVKIAWKKDIESLSIGSYDFLISEEINVALYKNIRDKRHIYCVTKNEEQIRGLFYDYKKIEKVSFNFELLLSKKYSGDEVDFNLNLFFSTKNLDDDVTLFHLVGKWNYYFYGTVADSRSEFRLWSINIEIFSDRSITYSLNNKCVLEGVIDTKYNKHQVFIKLNSLESKNLSTIIFSKRYIYKNIFKVSMLDKEYGTDYDMATFGIFSREELDEYLVKKALGNVDEVMLRENMELEKRINELYIESRF